MKKKGICYVCGGTSAQGVVWANMKQTICKGCSPLSDADRKAMRAKALEEIDRQMDAFPDRRAALLKALEAEYADLNLRRRVVWDELERTGRT